jgi:hypothetical protein
MIRKKYSPVFAGRTTAGETVVLYKTVGAEGELHILRPDGELWALSPGSEIEMGFDIINSAFQLSVKSPEWTGKATATKKDLLDALFINSFEGGDR